MTASLCYYSVFASTGLVRNVFELSETLVGFFVTAALLGYTVAFFPSGAAVDGFDEKPVLSAGPGALAVAVVAISFGSSYGALLLGGTVLGASAAIGGLVLALTQVAGSAARIGAGGLTDRLGGARGAATVAFGQVGLAVGFFAVLVVGVGSLPAALVVFAGLGVTIYGSLGVFYSCLSALVEEADIGAATAGGQTAVTIGGLLCIATLFALFSLAVVRWRL